MDPMETEKKVTAQDVTPSDVESNELSDTELDDVAGGIVTEHPVVTKGDD